MFSLSIGLMLAVLLLAIDLLAEQALTRFVLTPYPSLAGAVGKHVFVTDGKVVHVSEATANRRAVIVVLLATLLLLLFSGRLCRNKMPSKSNGVSLPLLASLESAIDYN